MANILSLSGASSLRASLSAPTSVMTTLTAALLVAGSSKAFGPLAWVGLGPLVFGTWVFVAWGAFLPCSVALGFLADRTDSLGNWSLGVLG